MMSSTWTREMVEMVKVVEMVENVNHLDKGDGGDLAHGDVKGGELAEGEEGGQAGVVPSQSCLATLLC